MKKKWLLGVLAIVMTAASAFGISACGGKGDSGNSSGSSVFNENSSSELIKDESSEISSSEDSSSEEVLDGSSSEENSIEEDYYTEGLVFTLQDDDTYAVTNYEGTATKVQIPSVYEDLPVTTIGDSVFYHCDSLTEIIIPDGVTNIGSSAFEDCVSLTKIVIPDSVTSIGNWAFWNCKGLTKIIIPDSVTNIIGYGAFGQCYSLTIYCEVESKPSGWSDDWNIFNRPVVWGYTEE